MPRAAGLVLVPAVLLLALVTLVDLSASRLYTWPWTLAAHGLWVTPLLVLGAQLTFGRNWRLPPFPLFLSLVLFVGATVLSAGASPFSAVSLPHLWPTLSGSALILVLHHALTATADFHRRTGPLAQGISIFGTALLVASFYYWSDLNWPLPWGSRNAAPFGHSTYTAGAVVLLLPWLVFGLCRARGLARAIGLVGVLLAGTVLIGTGSRAGALAVALVAVAAALVQLRQRTSRRQKLVLAFSLAAVVSVVTMSNPRLRALVTDRGWSDGARDSNQQRGAMLTAGARLGAERPALGWGPGTVPLSYPRVRAALDGGVDNVLQLHSTPLQIWATLGSFGSAAAGGLALAILALAWRTRFDPFARTASASLFGYGVMALTDHQLELPFFTALVSLNTAVISTSAMAQRPGRLAARPLRVGLCVGCLAVIIIAAPATLAELRGRRHYDIALTALAASDTANAHAALQAATRAAPHDPFYSHQQASLLLKARAESSEREQQLALTRRAVAVLQQSRLTGTHTEYADFNLGWLLLDLDDPRAAAASFRSAVQTVPDKSGAYFGLGLALLATGDSQGAARAFALEWINDPRSVTSPAWETPALASRKSAVTTETFRLLAELKASTPAAAVVEQWMRFWTGGSTSLPGVAFNRESRALLEALPAVLQQRPLADGPAQPNTPWVELYSLWLRQAPASDFQSVGRGDSEFALALARRAANERADFRAFLAGPVGGDDNLTLTFQRRRTGYGILARHPEGPWITDAFIVQEQRVAAVFAAELFPRKGTVPGRFLLALLPELPR